MKLDSIFHFHGATRATRKTCDYGYQLYSNQCSQLPASIFQNEEEFTESTVINHNTHASNFIFSNLTRCAAILSIYFAIFAYHIDKNFWIFFEFIVETWIVVEWWLMKEKETMGFLFSTPNIYFQNVIYLNVFFLK